MKKQTSQKVLRWEQNDYVKNLLVYAINAIVFMGLFVGALFVNGRTVDDVFTKTTDFFSYSVLIIVLFAVMAVYLGYENKNFLKNPLNSQMLFLIMELSFIVCFAVGHYLDYYLRPVALVALLTMFLADTKTGVFTSVLFSVIMFLFDTFSGINIEYACYLLVISISSSIIATYLLRNVYSRFKLLVKSFAVSIPAVVCVLLQLLRALNSQLLFTLIYATLSGVFSAGCCIIILPILEALFKKVTCFKYSELTDHRSKFIRKLIEQAPGTFNHSLVVSNIAEACATAIDEDPLLARVCAYYHDIGKIRRPEMFKENQVDKINLHNDLTPELSANIIRSHTQDGYHFLNKNRFPKIIADVCLQHHGTMPMLFFYDKARKFTDGDVDILQYCYQGPKPQTKIAAILMIADSSEAAARALSDRSRDNVLQLVRNIVNDRMKLGQFEECEITLKEINIIINTVVNSLTGVYHDRIEYPAVDIDSIKSDKTEE
ncbi:MAG: HDIG domain-containing protein [Clostridia bacterium]|nr:HDIG domain-containing protein [Clostridia bacterium]